MLAGLERGEPAVTLLRGDAGAGKAAVLDEIEQQASLRIRVLRTNAIESEWELAFASLHALLVPLCDRPDHLLPVSMPVLRSAFGLDNAPIDGDARSVWTASLDLLRRASFDGSILCLIDDAQWIDEASRAAMLFACRRLRDAPIAFIFTERSPSV